MASNGHLTKAELFAIPGGFLCKEAAAAWNAPGGPADGGLRPGGPDSSYRTYERQVYWREYWEGQGQPGNAAVPGTSNHGLGKAVDIPNEGEHNWMKESGAEYGWAKIEAPSEPWHWTYVGGVEFPVFEKLKKGDDGKRVTRLTKRLAFIHKKGGGPYLDRSYKTFKEPVEQAVRDFQTDFKLKVSGEIDGKTAATLNAVFHRQYAERGGKGEKATKVTKPAKTVKDQLGEAIDVSEAQGDIDWKKVGGKVKVAFAKATEGVTFTDSRFSGARVEQMQANVRAGFYHFARPDNNKPAAEAQHFVDTVHRAGGTFTSFEDWRAGGPGVVGVLDFEHEPFDTAWAAAWARKFKALTGVEPILYGYGSSLNPILGALKNFSCVWFAAYVKDWKPYFKGPEKSVAFWQDSDKWSCPGVSGKVDHSRYLG